MSLRRDFAEIVLWLALLFVGTMLGASVFQRVSLIPEWGGALPQSVVTYFHGTGAGAAIDRFWRGVTAPTALFMVACVWGNWPGERRKWTTAAGVLFFAMLLWTVVYFIPKGVVPLMQRGGDGMSPDDITRMARAWIFWDWFRMAGTLGCYLCLLKAATTPIAASSTATDGAAPA